MRLLRRLYSTFAGGWPGTGLVLMRLILGLTLVADGGAVLLSGPRLEIAIASVLVAAAGILLIVGFCTPIAGITVAIVEICRTVILPADRLACLLLATLAASLAMLGPGEWSVDARLFGWRRIEPSPQKR